MAAVAILFFIGFASILRTSNMIRMVIGIEIMARAASFAFVSFGFLHGNTAVSQSLVVTIIVVEVAVTATALAMIMNLYKKNKSLDVRNLTKLKG
jgi:NADH:ubiquinone oxidoreductase subunit K